MGMKSKYIFHFSFVIFHLSSLKKTFAIAEQERQCCFWSSADHCRNVTESPEKPTVLR
jgi:hypothetical protein